MINGQYINVCHHIIYYTSVRHLILNLILIDLPSMSQNGSESASASQSDSVKGQKCQLSMHYLVPRRIRILLP
jgi:hypothetical protein